MMRELLLTTFKEMLPSIIIHSIIKNWRESKLTKYDPVMHKFFIKRLIMYKKTSNLSVINTQ